MFASLLLSQIVFQQNDDTLAIIAGIVGGLIGMLVGIVMLVALWKIYIKAGQPGWAVLIPFYNVYVLLQIVGHPGWWLLFYFIPGLNVIVALVNQIELAQSFGKDIVFGLGLIFLNPIFTLLLAFGDAQYVGPSPLF